MYNNYYEVTRGDIIKPLLETRQEVTRYRIAKMASKFFSMEFTNHIPKTCKYLRKFEREFKKRMGKNANKGHKWFFKQNADWLNEVLKDDEWPPVYPKHKMIVRSNNTLADFHEFSSSFADVSDIIHQELTENVSYNNDNMLNMSQGSNFSFSSPLEVIENVSYNSDNRLCLSDLSFRQPLPIASKHSTPIKRKQTPPISTPKTSSSPRTKHAKFKHRDEILSNYELDEIVLALKKKLNFPDANYVLDKIVSNPSICTDLRHIHKNKNATPIKMTNDEGLSLMLGLNIPHSKYSLLKKTLKNKNADVLPCLAYVRNNKAKSMPEYVFSTETEFFVSLQSMQDHTLQRLSEKIEEPIKKSAGSTLKMISKIGIDGQSGRSPFNVKVSEDVTSDFTSIMHTAISPLLLKDERENIIWVNPNPSSCMTCRPLRMAWEKETQESMLREYARLKTEIKNLKPSEIIVDGKVYEVIHEILTTMFDGKAVCHITNTHTSRCPNCYAAPTDIVKYIENPKLYPLKDWTLDLGMSPLHMYLRALEWILNIAYRLEIKTWQIRKVFKPQVQDHMAKIHKGFKELLNVIVGRVNQGSGTSNTGNVARKIFHNPELTATITGVDVKLISNLASMLTAINSGFKINVEKFKKLGDQTARRAIELYSWCKIPPSMHRLCYHVPQFIVACPVNIGQTSEEPLETAHKMTLRALQHHARQNSYQAMNQDVGSYRLLETDPALTDHYIYKQSETKVSKPYPVEVLNLLDSSIPPTDCYEIIESGENIVEIEYNISYFDP